MKSVVLSTTKAEYIALEQCFGVQVNRLNILQCPLWLLNRSKISDLIDCWMIIHSIIIQHYLSQNAPTIEDDLIFDAVSDDLISLCGADSFEDNMNRANACPIPVQHMLPSIKSPLSMG